MNIRLEQKMFTTQMALSITVLTAADLFAIISFLDM